MKSRAGNSWKSAPVWTACLIVLAALSVSAETLHYTINWASGLSLGEAALTSTPPASESGESARQYSLMLDASLPGYMIRDEYASQAAANFCSIKLEKNVSRGARKSGEVVSFDQSAGRVTRQTKNGGGKSEYAVQACAKDALSYLAFLRQELSQGRLAPQQPVILGAAYDVEVVYTGSEPIQVGERRVEADRVQIKIQGPASQHTVEVYFDRDASRTPLLARIPLALGSFTVELLP